MLPRLGFSLQSVNVVLVNDPVHACNFHIPRALMPQLQRVHHNKVPLMGHAQVVEPALSCAACEVLSAYIDDRLTILEGHGRTALFDHTDQHEIEAHRGNMKHVLQHNL